MTLLVISHKQTDYHSLDIIESEETSRHSVIPAFMCWFEYNFTIS